MKKTKEDSEQTKAVIIEKAVYLFLKKGFSKTKLEEIAKEANVTRGAIYWHFKDKLDIVNNLIESEHQNLYELLNNVFSEDIDSVAKIENVVSEIVKNFFDDESFKYFIELTWFKIEYTELSRLQATKAELTDYFVNNFALIVREAKNLGKIKSELDELDVALTITHMINGMYRLYFILPDHKKNTKEETLKSFNSYLKLIKS